MPETKVIWKRPDGFHGASPEDYRTFELHNGTKLWLHRTDHENYPFRISGGWQDEVASTKLNTLINLLGHDTTTWMKTLQRQFEESTEESFNDYLLLTVKWAHDLQDKLKGDTWEQDIMHSALYDLCENLQKLKTAFQKADS